MHHDRGETFSFHLRLPRTREIAVQARRELRERLNHLEPDSLDDISLVVSELVTNAYRHGCGAIELHLSLAGTTITGEVIDEGSGFEHELREVGFAEVGGRGLLIVDALTERWGVYEGTTHVWFEIAAA